ncbi:hypothetical protein Ocin01_00228 [Orchesella cincta]|uniref:Uncharacterized protein n=1 Tax=Orchesella cincta TaxID=48709 RepID=A0A1D2NMI6_ORCCI|nr:hypothetical protein Ocin01_00228 [Orchesella cincta]
MEARKSGERTYDEAPIAVDLEESSNSFDAFTCYEPLSHLGLPNAALNDDDKKPIMKPLQLSNYDTPKIRKAQDFMHQPVRRRLIFSSQDEDDKENTPTKNYEDFTKYRTIADPVNKVEKQEISKNQLLQCHSDQNFDKSLQGVCNTIYGMNRIVHEH